jgi:hypothetical protein
VQDHFSNETVTQAFSTWVLVTVNVFADVPEAEILAMYVTRYFGYRLAHELQIGDASAPGDVLYAAFLDDLERDVMSERAARVRAVDPEFIETSYRSARSVAMTNRIDLAEMALAMREIPAVIEFVTSRMAATSEA